MEPPEKHLALLGYNHLDGLEMVSDKAGCRCRLCVSSGVCMSLTQEVFDMSGNGMALTAVSKVLAPLLVNL